MMSRGTSVRLAWSLCALALVLTALSLLLLNLNLSHPGTHIYDYWFENTISAVSLAPVGAYGRVPTTREPRGLAHLPVRPRHQPELLLRRVRFLCPAGATRLASRR